MEVTLLLDLFPGNLNVIGLKNRTKYDTVKKIWKQFCESGTTKFQIQAGGSKHLQPDDIELIRSLKTSRASMPTGELYKHVNDFCNVAGGTSLAAIHSALQKDMNDGKWTWKKLTQPVAEKFSHENMNYCQEFVNYIYTVDS